MRRRTLVLIRMLNKAWCSGHFSCSGSWRYQSVSSLEFNFQSVPMCELKNMHKTIGQGKCLCIVFQYWGHIAMANLSLLREKLVIVWTSFKLWEIMKTIIHHVNLLKMQYEKLKKIIALFSMRRKAKRKMLDKQGT